MGARIIHGSHLSCSNSWVRTYPSLSLAPMDRTGRSSWNPETSPTATNRGEELPSPPLGTGDFSLLPAILLPPNIKTRCLHVSSLVIVSSCLLFSIRNATWAHEVVSYEKNHQEVAGICVFSFSLVHLNKPSLQKVPSLPIIPPLLPWTRCLPKTIILFIDGWFSGLPSLQSFFFFFLLPNPPLFLSKFLSAFLRLWSVPRLLAKTFTTSKNGHIFSRNTRIHGRTSYCFWIIN